MSTATIPSEYAIYVVSVNTRTGDVRAVNASTEPFQSSWIFNESTTSDRLAQAATDALVSIMPDRDED